MIVLAVETITRAGSLALVADDRVIASVTGASTRSHAERLPGEILDLLAREGLTLGDLSLVAVVSGPGSFTGIRVGMAAVQGLVLAGRRPTIGIGTVEATIETVIKDHVGPAQTNLVGPAQTNLVGSARPDLVGSTQSDLVGSAQSDLVGSTQSDRQVLVCPVIDAARGEVYFAVYEVPESASSVDACRAVMGPGVAAPETVASMVTRLAVGGRRVVFVGDGALRYAEVLTGLGEGGFTAIGWPVPLAEGAARIAARRHAEAGAPHALKPLYVRRPDIKTKSRVGPAETRHVGPAGTDLVGPAGTHLVGPAETSHVGPAETGHVGPAQSDLVGSVGTDLVSSVGTDLVSSSRADREIPQESDRLASVESGLSIARALPSDIADVESLQRSTFTNPWGAAAIRWELDNTDVARLYVMRAPQGGLAGYCACWIVFDELHINSLAIDPALRRRGLARTLLLHVLAEARAAGATSSTLEVRASNVAARQLYEGLGFTVEAVRRDYYQQPREDALILWKRGI